MEPPPFQEASRCDVCKCSFTAFRRRHHCRCCGRTLCAEHSSDQMTLPLFGIQSNVRVCATCFNNGASGSKKEHVQDSPSVVNAVTDSFSRLDVASVTDATPEVNATNNTFPSGILECKCGMPLCICEAPAPQKVGLTLQPEKTIFKPVPLNQKPKKAESTPKNKGSTSTSNQSTFFNSGQAANSCMDTSSIDYEATGEGLREAIKNGDTAAARKLLSLGVDANYSDKQGSSLLHLAAVFNQTDIAFALMDHGARLDCKNSQGETPLDCAPVTLQYKMKKKIEDSSSTT